MSNAVRYHGRVRRRDLERDRDRLAVRRYASGIARIMH